VRACDILYVFLHWVAEDTSIGKKEEEEHAEDLFSIRKIGLAPTQRYFETNVLLLFISYSCNQCE